MRSALSWLPEKITLAKEKLSDQTNLAISSTEFCQCTFDECDIGATLRGGCSHNAMIPLSDANRARVMISDLVHALDSL